MMRGRARWSGVLSGFTLGCLTTLGLIAVQDRGAAWLPPVREAGAAAVDPGGAREVFLAGAWSTELAARADGRTAPCRATRGGAVVTLPVGALQLDIVHGAGTVWSTRLAGSADTLRAALGGEILVDVAPQGPTGVLVVDGAPVGEAPGTVTDVPAGWHTVSVVRDSVPVFTATCRVLPGEAAQVTVPPVPPHGQSRILVRSRTLGNTGLVPARGDAVSLDGDDLGPTPAEAAVEAGFHGIRVRRPGAADRVVVVHVAAGETREVDADFGRSDDLRVAVRIPAAALAGTEVAVPVHVEAADGAVVAAEAALHLVQDGQAEPVTLPLVPSRSDERVLVGLVPAGLVRGATLTGYAAVTDELGRTGCSELFRIPVSGPSGPASR